MPDPIIIDDDDSGMMDAYDVEISLLIKHLEDGGSIEDFIGDPINESLFENVGAIYIAASKLGIDILQRVNHNNEQ